MRTALALGTLLVTPLITTAQPAASASIPVPEHVTLANGAPGLIDPVLRPLEITPPLDPNCNGTKRNGKVGLSLVVDTQGYPRNIILEKPLGNGLDYLAIQLAESARFQPGAAGGSSVAVAGTMTLKIQSCEKTATDGKGHESLSLRPLAMPGIIFDLSPHISDSANLAPFDPGSIPPVSVEITGMAAVKNIVPPVPLKRVEAEFSDYARTHHIQGTCVYRLIVDEHGLPKDFQVVKPIDPSLQRLASDAVHKYRFKPAMKDGMPIRAQITVDVKFQFY